MIKQKQCWTEEEDALIIKLYEQRQIEDWTEIARIMSEQYNLPIKNQNLYKERYLNHLSSSIFKIQWSQQQEKLFLKLHNQIGNKWATIAQHLNGKSDNCVKNHFYSKLRKLLRKLNKIIQFFLKKQFKPIDISIMYKIVQAAEQRFKQKPNCELSVSQQCLSVQNRMLEFAMFKDVSEGDQQQQLKFTPSNLQEYKQLIKEIYRVSKLYKRKSKKVRNSLIQAPLNIAKKKNKKQPIKDQQEQQGDKTYVARQKTNNILIKNKNYQTQFQQKLKRQQQEHEQEEQFSSDSVKKTKTKGNNHHSRIQVEEGQGIQQLLRTAGILHDQIKINSQRQKVSRKYSNSQYSNNGNPMVSSPCMTPQQQPMNFMGNNFNADYSPLNSFSSQQVQSFLGFPIVKNGGANGYANFTLSQKSSFKSYSQIDPFEIDNPFFEQYSSNNGRIMFPMNFQGGGTNQLEQSFQSNQSFSNFAFPNVYYPQADQGEDQEFKTQQNGN